MSPATVGLPHPSWTCDSVGHALHGISQSMIVHIALGGGSECIHTPYGVLSDPH